MILSFFIFLIVSLSLVFGMASFIVGLHNNVPKASFNKEQYVINFNTRYFDYDNSDKDLNSGSDDTSGWDVQDFSGINISERLMNYSADVIENVDSNVSYEDAQLLVKRLLNKYHGNVSWFLTDLLRTQPSKGEEHESVRWWKKWSPYMDTVEKLTNFLEDNYGDTNLISYALYNNIFLKDDAYKNALIWNSMSPISEKISPSYKRQYYVFSKNNVSSQSYLNASIFSTKKYINENNVLFLSPQNEKKLKYKLGSKVSLKIGNVKQDYIYGGTLSTPEKFVKVQDNDRYFYYILNYDSNEKGSERNEYNDVIRDSIVMSYDNFMFSDPNSSLGKTRSLEYWKDLAYDSWLVPNEKGTNSVGWFSLGFLNTIHLVYTALLSLVCVFGIILILLDIIIAWFLIREIIRSLSKELLFLRTLGLKNMEASVLSVSSLGTILGVAFGLSIVGMLGIQELFINLVSSLIDVYFVWSTIQLFSLIVVFGVLAFLVVSYFTISIVMTKNLDLTSQYVVTKSSYSFAWFRDKLFNVNVNWGLTSSFLIKNIKKIFATLFITLLISCLTFIALGFKDSINQGEQRQKQVEFHNDNVSTNSSKNLNAFVYNRGEDKANSPTYKQGIAYSNEKLNSKDDIGDDWKKIISEDVTGKYITRKEFTKVLNDLSKSELADEGLQDYIKKIQKSFESFAEKYDSEINTLYPKADTNFKITFGKLSYGDFDSEVSFQMNHLINGSLFEDTLVVVPKSDSRYNKIFKNNKSPAIFDGDYLRWENSKPLSAIPVLPVTVGPKFLNSHNVSVGDYSNIDTKQYISNVDFHISNYWNYQDLLQTHIVSQYDGILAPDEVYIKQDDFINYLKFIKLSEDKNNNFTNDDFYDDLINWLSKGTFKNTFFSKGVPLLYQQFVIPSVYGDTNNKNQITTNRTFADYIKTISGQGLSELFSSVDATYYGLLRQANDVMLDPIVDTMIIILVLFIILDLSFIIFMVISIMNENDDIVFIMKALGYEKKEIFWRIVSGYLLSIIISVVVGTVVAGLLLSFLDGVFLELIGIRIALYFSGPIIGLFIALIIGLPGFVVAISSYRISARNLTVIEE